MIHLWCYLTFNCRAFWQRVPPPTPTELWSLQPKVVRDWNQDFQIGPDVRRIAPSAFIILSALVISPTVWEMLINFPKCLTLRCWWKWKSDPWSVSWTGPPPKNSPLVLQPIMIYYQISIKSINCITFDFICWFHLRWSIVYVKDYCWQTHKQER